MTGALSYFFILFFLGLVGLTGLFARHFSRVRTFDREEQKRQLEYLPPFFDFLYVSLFRPFVEFFNTVIHPKLLGLGEEGLRQFRMLVLRVENILHRLSDYFRGRRIAIENGNGNRKSLGPDVIKNPGANKILGATQSKNSEFWNEVRKFRLGLSDPKKYRLRRPRRKK
ncbi:hypothetical protein IIA95_02165 [Patescibacteria group bacterium]|nr:hypothetical protein [Patescibacteria group bacterium]